MGSSRKKHLTDDKRNDEYDPVFYVGKYESWHVQGSVYISDLERGNLEKLEWFTPIRVPASENWTTWIGTSVSNVLEQVDLAATDKGRRDAFGTTVPLSWFIGQRVGY